MNAQVITSTGEETQTTCTFLGVVILPPVEPVFILDGWIPRDSTYRPLAWERRARKILTDDD